MKRILTIVLTVIMGAAFMYVPAISFATEEDTAYGQDGMEFSLDGAPADQTDQTLEQAQRNLVIEAARTQVGYTKGSGPDIYTLKARELGHSAEMGWCGRFVWWCFYTTGTEQAYYDGMFTGSPKKLMEWATENDLFIDKSEAQAGDIIVKVYSNNAPHAGLIEAVDDEGTIHTIERYHYNCDDGVYQMTRSDVDYIIRPQYGE